MVVVYNIQPIVSTCILTDVIIVNADVNKTIKITITIYYSLHMTLRLRYILLIYIIYHIGYLFIYAINVTSEYGDAIFIFIFHCGISIVMK